LSENKQERKNNRTTSSVEEIKNEKRKKKMTAISLPSHVEDESNYYFEILGLGSVKILSK
jgi:hypothetical protein